MSAENWRRARPKLTTMTTAATMSTAKTAKANASKGPKVTSIGAPGRTLLFGHRVSAGRRCTAVFRLPARHRCNYWRLTFLQGPTQLFPFFIQSWAGMQAGGGRREPQKTKPVAFTWSHKHVERPL